MKMREISRRAGKGPVMAAEITQIRGAREETSSYLLCVIMIKQSDCSLDCIFRRFSATGGYK